MIVRKHIARVAGLLALPLVLAGGTSNARPFGAEGAGPAPAAPAPEAEAAPEPEGGVAETPEGGQADRGADTSSVPEIQSKLEGAMAELGALAAEAEADGDATRSACVKGWQQKGQDAMEVATSELLVIRDDSTTDLARSFAVEKLAATSERLDAIVGSARKCSGDQSPEENDDEARTEVDETKTIPLEDPTLGGGTSPVLPPIDPNLPSTAASPAM
jgi:hypothetical protein